MNNTLPSSFVFLASEKISSDSLFEGFNVDLESTANLVKSLADYNPTVWSYMSAITKGVMQPLGVAILAVVLVLEFSKMAKKIANSGGAMTFEAIAPMIVSYIMVAVVITNTTVIVEAILAIASHIIEGVAGVVSHGERLMRLFQDLKGQALLENSLLAFLPF